MAAKNSPSAALSEKLREVHATLSRLDEELEKTPAYTQNINLLGKDLTCERYGFCNWSKICLLDGNREVYRLARKKYCDPKRKEYFFGRKFREYTGNRFCFVEYWTLVLGLNEIPQAEAVSEACNVREKTVRAYERFARRITGNCERGLPLV
jgi:hypothetical protein